jgi:stage II sporulation protein D
MMPPAETGGQAEHDGSKAPPGAEDEPWWLSGGSPDSAVAPEGVFQAVPGGSIPEVRVLILETRKSVRVHVESGELSIIDSRGDTALSWPVAGEIRFGARGDEVSVSGGGGPAGQSSSILITGTEGSFVRIEGRPYRGSLCMAADGQGGLLAINILGMEDYIRGVLPSEIGYLKEGQYEAFRAQAIASRSYALSKMPGKRAERFDLRATVMDQVYKGVEGENAEASRAVDETRGVVGLWEGVPITAYYSSCCGGHTADSRIGWPSKASYPYLYGVRDADRSGMSFCADSRHFRWEESWHGDALHAILEQTLRAEFGKSAASFGRIVDMEIEGFSESGRVIALDIVTDNGSYRVEGDRVRWVLRPRSADGPILRSTLFKMDVDRSGGRVAAVRVRGAGNGHGTGMCQSGAIRMAGLGYSAVEILVHYYPGITIESVY